MGTQIRLKSLLAIALGAAIWLCPLWLIPTPAVAPLLWGAACLALWLLMEALSSPHVKNVPSLHTLFWLLLVSLACMIAWRSRDLPNALAVALCLASIGLAARLAAKLNTTKAAHVIAWGWLLAGLINSAIGLMQYFGLTAEPLGTAFGLLRQRNQLATLCNIALLSLLYLWHRHSRTPNTASLSRHMLAVLACALLTAALAATCSRAGLLELLVLSCTTLVYGLVMRRRHIVHLIIFALASYALYAWWLPLASGSPETILGRISILAPITGDPTNPQLQDGRRLLWANALTLIHAHPLLGVGWRELASTLHTTDFGVAARFSDQADNAHNLPLQFAVELGLPFTALWFGLVAWLIFHYKPWCARAPEQILAWGVLTAIGLHSLLEYPLWYAPFQIAVGLSAGILFVRTKPSVLRNNHAAVSPIWHALASLGLLCFCAYAAFDYHRIRQMFIANDERSSFYIENTYAKAHESWLFAAQVRFAKLTTTPATPDNAAELWQLGHEVLHFSPEPVVFQALIHAGEWLAPHDPAIAAELAALQNQLQTIESSQSNETPPLK